MLLQIIFLNCIKYFEKGPLQETIFNPGTVITGLIEEIIDQRGS